MEDTGLPSDALRWTLEYFLEQWSDSIYVITETMEEAGAPGLVLDMLYEMCKAQANDNEEGN